MFFNKTNKYKIHEENDFKILKISVKDLVSNYTIQNYYKNRPPDNVRINFLEEFFTINDTFLLPQIVSSWEKDDKLFIYDGIHRLTASMNLFKNKNKNMLVIIKIFTTKDETKIIKDFK